jgi:hypothetical protein
MGTKTATLTIWILKQLVTIWIIKQSKINRKCYRKCDFQAFHWLTFTLTTDLRLTTFCEIDHWILKQLK